jgi:hypothetical protein
MGEIIPIHTRRTFSQEEAEHLLPIVRRITARAAAEATALQEELRFLQVEEPKHERICANLSLCIERWQIKISRLGCEPRGIWHVGFDAGEGWYAWRLGDEALAFFHGSEAFPSAALPSSDGAFHA